MPATTDSIWMAEALALARRSLAAGGGPFGAVVVRDGGIVGAGANAVVPGHDPTAHAEIVAIRRAAAALGSFALTGCAIYCSCEPCPMCLGAIYWARLDRVVYAADRGDAAAGGFADATIYRELSLAPEARSLPFRRADVAAGREVFAAWCARPDRTQY